VDRGGIQTRREACLRTCLNFDRIAVLEARARKHAQFPPVILYQAPDGALILVDGWNRLVVCDRLGIILVPALVIETSLEDALIAGLRMNIPRDGKLRAGSDAAHALVILATALGRSINVAEAASLGLAHTPNAPVSPDFVNSLCLPQFPEAPAKPGPERGRSERKFGKGKSFRGAR
jgi:hypothetical protein